MSNRCHTIEESAPFTDSASGITWRFHGPDSPIDVRCGEFGPVCAVPTFPNRSSGPVRMRYLYAVSCVPETDSSHARAGAAIASSNAIVAMNTGRMLLSYSVHAGFFLNFAIFLISSLVAALRGLSLRFRA
jgi:hypothetical protein